MHLDIRICGYLMCTPWIWLLGSCSLVAWNPEGLPTLELWVDYCPFRPGWNLGLPRPGLDGEQTVSSS